MKIKIAKTFDFDAAHWLPNVPEDHKCRQLHGHTYRVELMCEGEVGSDGMLLDYAEIAKVWWPIHDVIDHRCLNDIEGLENPTSEVFAHWLLSRLPAWVTAARVYESPATWAEAAR
jgi:6-pyruvoyltetrahydropterin/6-carboxytetrahydropterin synthase